MIERPDEPEVRTPLAATLTLAATASFGTGVIWNGLPFIAKHDYGYTQIQNLGLYAVIGFIYIVGAKSAGPLLRRFARIAAPRTVLAIIVALQTAICFLPLLLTIERDPRGVSIWIVAGVTGFLASLFWPIVESYVTSGRHGRPMRTALGWFNVAWTAAVAAALITMAPLVERDLARMAIVIFGGLSGIGLVALAWFQRHPPEHAKEKAREAVPANYAANLRAARVLLALSYLLMSAVSPLLPYLLTDIGVSARWETPSAAVWMTTRIVAMSLMWKLAFWHGRWATLVMAGLGMTAGFGMVVAAPSLAVMLAGLVVFGAALAVTYYAALYYAMAVGHAEVDAGGGHESMIGAGYAAGPLVTLAAILAAPTIAPGLATETVIIGAVWAVVGVVGGVVVWRAVRAGR